MTKKTVKKTLSYRLFGFGTIPGKLRPVLEREHIIVSDEGMAGRFVTRELKAPWKRYVRRAEGFSGCLVVTGERVVCFTYGKRQINIAVTDPRLSELFVNAPDRDTLSISFESSAYRRGWSGVIELRFSTELAKEFRRVLESFGASRE